MSGAVGVTLVGHAAVVVAGVDVSVVAAAVAAAAVVAGAMALGVVGQPAARVAPQPGRTGRTGRTGAGVGRRREPGAAPTDPVPVRRSLAVAVAASVVVVALTVSPVAAVAGVAVVGVLRLRAARRQLRRHQRLIESSVPDLVDLFVIAAAAGHPVQACLAMVAERAPEAVRPALADARTSVERGRPLAAALHALGLRLGVLGPTLTGALATAAATGAPLGPALQDVAALARDRRRREAENEARRLPVTLLFPLVCCVLPAFVLLAVVPLLAASLAALEI